jgi:hypothetical protein
MMMVIVFSGEAASVMTEARRSGRSRLFHTDHPALFSKVAWVRLNALNEHVTHLDSPDFRLLHGLPMSGSVHWDIT